MALENPYLLAGLLAAVFTFCDLEFVFNAPPTGLDWGPWFRLLIWRWGFILLNGAIASALFAVLRDKDFLKPLSDPWIKALVVGAGYSTLIRQKFISLPDNGSFGLDGFYQMVRGLVNGRINRIIRQWRMDKSRTLADEKNVEELRHEALLKIGSDAVLTDEQKKKAENAINETVNNTAIPDADKCRYLAMYLVNDKTNV